LKLIAKRLAGLALTALGTVLLTVALEQLLDPPEQPGDYLPLAGAAGITGAILIGTGFIVTAIAFAAAKRGERWKTAKMVVKLIATPTTIAFSVAISFVISAAAAALIGKGAGGVIAGAGALLIAGGFFLGRGFWLNLGKALLNALKEPPANPPAADPGSASDGTGPAPSQS